MSNDNQNVKTGWSSVQVYTLSAICLLMGVTIGYLFRGSTARKASAPAAVQAQMPAGANGMSGASAPPTPEAMKRMAEKQVAPLLDQLNKNPNDTDTLIKVGGYYSAAQQFDNAITYYQKAVNIKPTADVLTKLSIAQFYGGAGEKAIASLNQALQINPKYANALYDLGMMKWQVKGDMKGAIECWEKLLKVTPANNPNRAAVEKMIARAKEHEKLSGGKTDKPAM